jgi:hypothetical protein
MKLSASSQRMAWDRLCRNKTTSGTEHAAPRTAALECTPTPLYTQISIRRQYSDG